MPCERFTVKDDRELKKTEMTALVGKVRSWTRHVDIRGADQSKVNLRRRMILKWIFIRMMKNINEKMIHKDDIERMIKERVGYISSKLINIKQELRDVKRELNELRELLNGDTKDNITRAIASQRKKGKCDTSKV